jgi:hypothetical protein
MAMLGPQFRRILDFGTIHLSFDSNTGEEVADPVYCIVWNSIPNSVHSVGMALIQLRNNSKNVREKSDLLQA